MVIPIINQIGVSIFKTKCDAIVARNGDRPNTFFIAG